MAENSISREEWERRYIERLMQQGHVTHPHAKAAFDSVPFEELSEDFENDPEGAADEEMGCWDDDFDEDPEIIDERDDGDGWFE